MPATAASSRTLLAITVDRLDKLSLVRDGVLHLDLDVLVLVVVEHDFALFLAEAGSARSTGCCGCAEAVKTRTRGSDRRRGQPEYFGSGHLLGRSGDGSPLRSLDGVSRASSKASPAATCERSCEASVRCREPVLSASKILTPPGRQGQAELVGGLVFELEADVDRTLVERGALAVGFEIIVSGSRDGTRA